MFKCLSSTWLISLCSPSVLSWLPFLNTRCSGDFLSFQSNPSSLLPGPQCIHFYIVSLYYVNVKMYTFASITKKMKWIVSCQYSNLTKNRKKLNSNSYLEYVSVYQTKTLCRARSSLAQPSSSWVQERRVQCCYAFYIYGLPKSSRGSLLAQVAHLWSWKAMVIPSKKQICLFYFQKWRSVLRKKRARGASYMHGSSTLKLSMPKYKN